MRTISYNEYILNIKSDFYYINLVFQVKQDDTYLKKVLLNEEQHFEKFYDKHPVTMFVEYLEVLVHDNIVTPFEVNKYFLNAEINCTEHYKRLCEYIYAYKYRQSKIDFPFKLQVNIDKLKEKVSSLPLYKEIEHNFTYIPYNFTAMTYEELMESYVNSELYDTMKELYECEPAICSYKETIDIFSSYQYELVTSLINVMQIFIDEGILSNILLNKLLSETELYNYDEYLLIFDYLNEYLFIKNTTWHKYTLDIDVDMLLNKVILYYCSEYKNLINQERFNAIFEKYNIKVDYNIPLEQRNELDMFYREKYRKLYEAELKEKANK